MARLDWTRQSDMHALRWRGQAELGKVKRGRRGIWESQSSKLFYGRCVVRGEDSSSLHHKLSVLHVGRAKAKSEAKQSLDWLPHRKLGST